MGDKVDLLTPEELVSASGLQITREGLRGLTIHVRVPSATGKPWKLIRLDCKSFETGWERWEGSN